MARILIFTLAVRGHVNPIRSLAEHLVRRGHHVTWMARKVTDVAVAPQVDGVIVRHVDWQWLPPGKKLDFAGAARHFDKYVENNVDWRLRSIDPLVPRLRAAIREHRPDMIVADGQMYPGIIAAIQEDVPFVTAITSPAFMMPPDFDCDLTRALRLLDGPRAESFRKHGVEPNFVVWDFLSPLENFVFALPELVGSHRPLPERTHLVGSSVYFERQEDPADYPWDRIHDRAPLVYASFGTVWYAQPDLFHTIATTCVELGLQLAATIGGLADTDFPRTLPPEVVAVRHTPQLKMLERASVCITHGGANTVMEALYFGVPQLVVPLCTDQPVNAFFVRHARVGLDIAPAALTPERCREALLRLVSPDSPEREVNRRVRAAYRANDGAQIAAQRIDALVS